MPEPDLYLTDYNVSVPAAVHADDDAAHARAADFHRTTMSLFGITMTRHARAEHNVLWRLERRPDHTWHIIIQSTTPPTPEAASLPHITVKPVTGLFDALQAGTLVQYRVQITAVERINAPQPDRRPRRKNIALTKNQARTRWETRTAPACGLDLTPHTLEQHRIKPHLNEKPITNPAKFVSDLFSGTATITNPETLTHAIRHGIGTGKPYGRGMLTAIPLQHHTTSAPNHD